MPRIFDNTIDISNQTVTINDETVFTEGVSATGSDIIDFSGSSGDFKTSRGNIHIGSPISNTVIEGFNLNIANTNTTIECSNLNLKNDNIGLYGISTFMNGLKIGESSTLFKTIQYGRKTNKENLNGEYIIEFEFPFKDDKFPPHILININNNNNGKDELNYGYFLKNIDNNSFTYRLYVLKNTNPVEYVIPDLEHEIIWMAYN